MKTLNEIIREWLAARKREKKEANDSQKPEEATRASDNKPKLLTTKQTSDETEDHESAGDFGLDHTDAGENHGISEEPEQQSVDSGGNAGDTDGAGKSIEGADEAEDAEDAETSLTDPLELPEVKEALQQAYREGEIAGRNAVIEERYFPTTDDGLPHFRGRTSRQANAGDIFSMAREA